MRKFPFCLEFIFHEPSRANKVLLLPEKSLHIAVLFSNVASEGILLPYAVPSNPENRSKWLDFSALTICSKQTFGYQWSGRSNLIVRYLRIAIDSFKETPLSSANGSCNWNRSIYRIRHNLVKVCTWISKKYFLKTIAWE